MASSRQPAAERSARSTICAMCSAGRPRELLDLRAAREAMGDDGRAAAESCQALG